MQDLSIKSCVAQNKKALTYGNRLILPFHCRFISITIGFNMSTISTPTVYYDFSDSDRDVRIVKEDQYTSVYFAAEDHLNAAFGKHQGGVILACCELSDDIFDVKVHRRLRLRFRDDQPVVTIESME
ncbi:hypothetical protein K1X84_11010 [bacterium]|nr:hypothetical protein [bacterium]